MAKMEVLKIAFSEELGVYCLFYAQKNERNGFGQLNIVIRIGKRSQSWLIFVLNSNSDGIWQSDSSAQLHFFTLV